MDDSFPEVLETDRFKQEAQRLLASDGSSILAGLVWALTRNPFWGQQVKGGDQRAWVLYRGGYAYLAYYSISGKTVTLESILKRETPIAPGPLGLES